MCSGSEAGSYLRVIDLVYHSTLGLRGIQKQKKDANTPREREDLTRTDARVSGLKYRGTSLIRKRLPLGPYCRAMSMVLRRS